jgi:cob(I)alamin adenosyltransferase
MNYSLEAFTLIKKIQHDLSNLSKSPAQEKKFKQFQMNFEKMSSEFMNMLDEYKKKNEKLSSQDFEESDFR